LAIAAGERFFCSRMGVKDWARAREQVSANANGRCLKCMGASVTNLRGFEKCVASRLKALTRISADDTD
jgi:hypothetical protein